MESIRKNLTKTRPSLRHIAPFVYFMSWGYAVTNQFIGLSLLHTKALPYVFTRGVLGPKFWGIFFITLGLAGATAILLNRWRLIRRLLMVGLGVKALFLYGLLLTMTWQSLGIIGIWLLIGYAQFLTVVFFPEDRYGGV